MTLTTEHFAVTTYDEGVPLARRAAAFAEEAWAELTPVLGWEPEERVQIVVLDEVDSANGFAGASPYDAVILWAFPPEMDSSLGDYDDWLKVLVFHELTHVFHLDNATGVPRLLNRVFGKTLKPNEALPRWFTEGLAVWVESTFTGGGRVRSSRFEMILRTAALAGTLPSLSRLTGDPLFLPRGTSWYLYGGYLFDWIARHAGPEAISRLLHAYGRRLIPYAINTLARRATGKSMVAWYEELLADIRRRARATAESLEAAGRIEGTRRTTGGEDKRQPRFTHDGRHLVYIDGTGHRATRLVRAPVEHPEDAETVVLCDGGCSRFAITRDDSAVVVATVRPFRQVHSYGELLRVPLDPGRSAVGLPLLTDGARAHDPAITPDGRAVWVVSSSWGRTWLEALDPLSGDRLARWDPPPGARIDAPVPHPDGHRLFASMHVDGNRDLIEVDLRDGSWRRLTTGASLEIQPALTADGRWLLYSSDATGIYDIYAMDVSGEPGRGGTVVRLTRVLTGAFEPAVSPDGSTLVYVGWTAAGDELYTLPFAPDTAERVATADPLPPLVAPSAPPAEVDGPYPYDPLPTLLPRSWAPTFSVDTTGLGRVGLSLGGADVTGRYAARLSAAWDFDREQLDAAASVALGFGYPDLALSVGRYTSAGQTFIADRVEPYVAEVFFASLDASIALPSVFVPMRFGVGYSGDITHATSAAPVIYSPDSAVPYVPREGASTALTLFWTFSDAESYAFSISTAKGVQGSMSLRLRDPAIGSHATSYLVRGQLRGWFPIVRSLDHVGTLQLRSGFSGGEPGARGVFSIGGVPRQDILQDIIDNTQAGAVWLRGFRADAFRGTTFLLATAEYRLPLLRLRGGLDTLPVFLRDLTFAVFSDAGLITSDPLADGRFDDLHTSVGAELRLGTELFFSLPLRFRLGYAHGFGAGGIDHVYLLMAADP
ncbi:MAG: PD40 domain-containing protein [Deltaproteobacteria bacterium]|nr:PD40 domain-containing protein [Deltaproteobacteria bacterium]